MDRNIANSLEIGNIALRNKNNINTNFVPTFCQFSHQTNTLYVMKSYAECLHLDLAEFLGRDFTRKANASGQMNVQWI